MSFTPRVPLKQKINLVPYRESVHFVVLSSIFLFTFLSVFLYFFFLLVSLLSFPSLYFFLSFFLPLCIPFSLIFRSRDAAGSLNDCCITNPDCEVKLSSASSVHSAVIVTASQFRVRQGARVGGCKITIEAAEADNLIVAVVEANLRQGRMNDSCIDYFRVRNFAFPSCNDAIHQPMLCSP